MKLLIRSILVSIPLFLLTSSLVSAGDLRTAETTYHTVQVGEVEVFYRAAGEANAPVLILLHGFPSSSHQYRELIPLLANKFRVIAPDYPGFGNTVAPGKDHYDYTFDNLANTMQGFTEALNLNAFSLYVFDYGAPIGFRMALANPEKVTAIISQNGNVYEEGLSDAWAPVKAYWNDASLQNRNALRGLLKYETTRWQYITGAPTDRLQRISPDSIAHDQSNLDRNPEIQLDLFQSYASNVAAYPEWQAYLRENTPPLLALWGKNDPFFLPAGAHAFKRDVPHAIVEFVDAGHFPLETHLVEIAERIHSFLESI